MSEKRLVICDHELRYASSLAENILERKELHLKVCTFTDIEKVITYAREHTIHIFVVDESFEVVKRKEVQADTVFILVRGGEGKLLEKERAIYKYQGANDIIQEVFECYVEQTNASIFKGFRKNHTKLEAIYSPIRGIGKTRFAIALGKERAKREKVLYLNLEEYAGFEAMELDEDRTNLGDLIYFLRQNEGNLGLRLPSAVQKLGELDYVPPVFLAVDLKEIEKEDWLKFLEQISALSLYDAILLDLSESVQGLFAILEQCDVIYMPIKEDDASNQKLRRYELCLERLKLERIKYCTNQFVLPEQVEEFVRTRMKEDGKYAD